MKSHTIALTGLLNRSCLSDTLESITQQNVTPFFYCGSVDINSFKAINDMHGNYIGDKVLQHVAETLRRTLPENNLTFVQQVTSSPSLLIITTQSVSANR
ncbi:diguanylate cyclase domain-containing protein [Vibrio cyclitrophicus]